MYTICCMVDRYMAFLFALLTRMIDRQPSTSWASPRGFPQSCEPTDFIELHDPAVFNARRDYLFLYVTVDFCISAHYSFLLAVWKMRGRWRACD